MMNTSPKKEKLSRLLYSGWFHLFIFLVALGFMIKPLQRAIFDMVLWQNLINNVDHRLTEDPKKNINSEGIRSYHTSDYYKEEDFNIIFAGDSFAYGLGMPIEGAPPFQLEKQLRNYFHREDINVINFGWSSSSPYLSLRLLQDLGKAYKPDVVIFLLDLTDFKDDWFYKNILHKTGHYRFLIEHPYLGYLVRSIARETDSFTGWYQELMGFPDWSTYFTVHQPYEKSEPFFNNVYESLLEMNSFTENELHAPLFVFSAPRHWQYTDKESPNSWEAHAFVVKGPYALNNFIWMDKVSATAPFPMVSLLKDFQNTEVFPTTFEDDSHWNQAGANVAATAIFRHCLKLNCFEKLLKTNPDQELQTEK
ncbi:MAG: SGNH/GDSL hydrolase family protein [Pseudomonadales bacterium]|nr:SGNH/GDSL hydrolase family protein [Pseudomonadales bacterium]